MFFNENGAVLASLGSTKAELSNILGEICNGYNTNIRTALGVALDEVLSSDDQDAAKSIVPISDGGVKYGGDTLLYDREVLERAKAENVRIYTVAVGDNAVKENMEEIANVTDGLAFTYRINNSSDIADEVFAHQAYHNYIKVTPTEQIKDEDIHYFRNELNRAPATRDELIAEKEKWKLLPIGQSLYHMYGEDGVFNTKFISNEGEGKYEGVYNKEI